MYPDDDLKRLAWHKAALRQRIGLQREVCAAAVDDLVQPLYWMDRAVTLWKHIKPYAKLAAIPLALLAKRLIFPRFKLFGSLLRFGPAIFGAYRMASAMRRP